MQLCFLHIYFFSVLPAKTYGLFLHPHKYLTIINLQKTTFTNRNHLMVLNNESLHNSYITEKFKINLSPEHTKPYQSLSAFIVLTYCVKCIL